MSSLEHSRDLPDAGQAAVSSGFYAGYVDRLHCWDFPEDRVYTEELSDSELITEDGMRRTWPTERIQLVGQLATTIGMAHIELGIARRGQHIDNLPAAHLTQAYMLEVVGPLAMSRIPAEWFDKNLRLQKLRNPFEDFELTRFIQRYHRDNRLIAGIGRIAAPHWLAPGYFS